jgi:L-ribulose-5-phosphate 4-epimerase
MTIVAGVDFGTLSVRATLGDTPAVLVSGHAPFCWGRTPLNAAQCSVILEEIAQLALHTGTANPKAISKILQEKHFLRKHGSTGYYGQT